MEIMPGKSTNSPFYISVNKDIKSIIGALGFYIESVPTMEKLASNLVQDIKSSFSFQ
jgi:hypothetical protein